MSAPRYQGILRSGLTSNNRATDGNLHVCRRPGDADRITRLATGRLPRGQDASVLTTNGTNTVSESVESNGASILVEAISPPNSPPGVDHGTFRSLRVQVVRSLTYPVPGNRPPGPFPAAGRGNTSVSTINRNWPSTYSTIASRPDRRVDRVRDRCDATEHAGLQLYRIGDDPVAGGRRNRVADIGSVAPGHQILDRNLDLFRGGLLSRSRVGVYLEQRPLRAPGRNECQHREPGLPVVSSPAPRCNPDTARAKLQASDRNLPVSVVPSSRIPFSVWRSRASATRPFAYFQPGQPTSSSRSGPRSRSSRTASRSRRARSRYPDPTEHGRHVAGANVVRSPRSTTVESMHTTPRIGADRP